MESRIILFHPHIPRPHNATITHCLETSPKVVNYSALSGILFETDESMSSRPDSHGRDVEDVPNKAEYDVDHVEHDAVRVNTQGPLETKFAGVLIHTPVDITRCRD